MALVALVAELVDAADSKSAVRKDMRVRVSPRAPIEISRKFSILLLLRVVIRNAFFI